MTEAARSLATEEGLQRFLRILAAIDLWRDRLTPTQRRLLNAGGGPCAKVTADRLAALGLVGSRVDGAVQLTGLGEFVVAANRNPTSSGTS